MMVPYVGDRPLSNFIHANLAVPKIYKELAWKEKTLDEAVATDIDMHKGIDYVFTDQAGNFKTVQERFRRKEYERYGDFTIRYKRDLNQHADRRESEYFKMEADYFVYGITNISKRDDYSTFKGLDFLKFAVVDLNIVYSKIDSGQIIIKDNNKNVCSIEQKRIVCPIKYNPDGSSSFFPVEIKYLVELWGDEVILLQKGFM